MFGSNFSFLTSVFGLVADRGRDADADADADAVEARGPFELPLAVGGVKLRG